MLNNGKAKIENSAGTLSIIIPSKKNWFALLFGTAWLGGWYFGLTNVLTSFGKSDNDNIGVDGFITFWLVGWTIGGLAIIFILLWGYFGQEKIISDRNELLFEKTIFNIGLKKRMDVREIRNFRTEKVMTGMFGNNGYAFWGLGPGKIKFDYGLKTYSFALGVDDAEANHLVEILNAYFKK
ncbi:MAG: hypothetical protein ABI723_24740 [Bacteroidia bacterium]